MTIRFLSLLMVLSLVACKGSSPGGGQPLAPAQGPAAPPASGSAPAQGPFSGKGTSSLGGGGNGIDGVAVEAYANTNIESLPEYRRHILPILRKLSVGKPDVLVAYLLWAVRQKAWYFIPRKLENLAKEKVQLLFRSDQLALHGETEIFIEQEPYQNSSMKDRAVLLLHEMVMAARLLMKKSPQVQCEALSKTTELNVCRDREMLKIAAPMVLDKDDDIHSLNGLDHSSVRSLTVYLGDDKQDRSGTAVFAQRIRLGFVFPWDALLSKLTAEDLDRAIQRSALAQDIFRSRDSQCVMSVIQSNAYEATWIFNNLESPPAGKPWPPSIIPEASAQAYQQDYGLTSGSWISIPKGSISSTSLVETRGTTDLVFGDGAIVDAFEILPNVADPGEHIFPKVEFYVSRTQKPRILGFRLTQIRGLIKEKGVSLLRKWSEIEWVVDKSMPPVECKLAN